MSSAPITISDGAIWYLGRIVARLEPLPYVFEREVIDMIEGLDADAAYQRGYDNGGCDAYDDGFRDGLQEAADRVAAGKPILKASANSQAPQRRQKECA